MSGMTIDTVNMMEDPRPAPPPPSQLIAIPYERTIQSAGVVTKFPAEPNYTEPQRTSTRMRKFRLGGAMGTIADQQHTPASNLMERRKLKSDRDRKERKHHQHSQSVSEAASRRTQLYSNFGSAFEVGTITVISGGASIPPVSEEKRKSAGSRQKSMFRRSSLSPTAIPSTLDARRTSRGKLGTSTYAKHGHSLSHSGFDNSFDPTTLRKNRIRPRQTGMSGQDHLYQEYDDLFDDLEEVGEKISAQPTSYNFTASPFSTTKKVKPILEPLEPIKPSANILNVADSDTEDELFLLHFSEATTALAATDDLHADPASPPALSDGGSSVEDSHSGEPSDHDEAVHIHDSSDEHPLPPSPLPPVTPLKFSFKSNLTKNHGRRQSNASSVYSSYTLYTTATVAAEDRHIQQGEEVDQRHAEADVYVPSPLSSARSSWVSLAGRSGASSVSLADGFGGEFSVDVDAHRLTSAVAEPKLERWSGAYALGAALNRLPSQADASTVLQRSIAGSASRHPSTTPHQQCTTSTTTVCEAHLRFSRPQSRTPSEINASLCPPVQNNNPPPRPSQCSLPAPASVSAQNTRLVQLQRAASPSSIYSDDSSYLALRPEDCRAPLSHPSIFDNCTSQGFNISNLHSPILPEHPEQGPQSAHTLSSEWQQKGKSNQSFLPQTLSADLDSDDDDDFALFPSPVAASPGKLLRHFGIPDEISRPKTAVSDSEYLPATPDSDTMRTERKSCLFDEVDGLGVAPLFYTTGSKKHFSSLHVDTPRSSLRQSMITITSPLSPLHQTALSPPRFRGEALKPVQEMESVRDSMISALHSFADSDSKFVETCEPWTPETPAKQKEHSILTSPASTVGALISNAFEDANNQSDGESCASEVIGDQDSMKEVVMRPKTQFFNPSAWQYYDHNYQIESKVAPEIREEKLIADAAAPPEDPTKDTTYLRAFRTYIKRSGPHDAFIQRQTRLEATQAERIFRDVKKIETTPMSKKQKLTQAMVTKASKQRQAQEEILSSLWSLMAERWLCFGKVVCSPAHDVLLAASAKKLNKRIKERKDRRASEMLGHGVRIELDDGSERRRVLDLGGEPIAGWGWHCAYDYPKAKVYTVSRDASQVSGEEEAATENPKVPVSPRGPRNHRHVIVPKMWELPFPDNHFDLVSARNLFTLVTGAQHTSTHSGKLLDEMDLVIEECNRVLKPGGYFEYMVMDAEMLNAGPAGQSFNAMFAAHLEERGNDAAPSRRFIKRLNRNGFKKIQRAWIFHPLAPTLIKPIAQPKQEYERAPLPHLPGSPSLDAERAVNERRDESMKKVDDRESLGELKGDVQSVAAISGMLAGRMLEKWGITSGLESKAMANILSDVIREEVEGKRMGGFRTLVGWARKTPKVHSI